MSMNQSERLRETWLAVPDNPHPADLGQPPRPDLAGVITEEGTDDEQFLLYNPDEPTNSPTWIQIDCDATVHPSGWQ